MHIRPATIIDIPALTQLFTVLDTDKGRFSAKTETYIPFTWIAEKDKAPLGAIVLHPEHPRMALTGLVSTRKGVGSALIAFALDRCREGGFVKLYGWSLASYKAYGFYEKMGFEEIYLMKRHYHGEDMYFLGKLVNPVYYTGNEKSMESRIQSMTERCGGETLYHLAKVLFQHQHMRIWKHALGFIASWNFDHRYLRHQHASTISYIDMLLKELENRP